MTSMMHTVLQDDTVTIRDLHDLFAQKENNEVAAGLRAAVTSLTLTPARRSQCIAALWASGQRPLLKEIFELSPAFTEPAVLGRAAEILDLPRRARALSRKLATLEAQKCRQSK